MKTVTSRCSFTKSLSRLIFLLCCYLHFPAQKYANICRGGSQTPAKTHKNCDLQVFFYKIFFKTYLPLVLLLTFSCSKRNVNSCRGGSQTPAKTHENCDLQVFFYKISFKTYLPLVLLLTFSCSKKDVNSCRGGSKHLQKPMKTVTSRCSFTKSLSRLIFLLCCYLHFPAQKKCKQLQGRFPNTCKNP